MPRRISCRGLTKVAAAACSNLCEPNGETPRLKAAAAISKACRSPCVVAPLWNEAPLEEPWTTVHRSRGPFQPPRLRRMTIILWPESSSAGRRRPLGTASRSLQRILDDNDVAQCEILQANRAPADCTPSCDTCTSCSTSPKTVPRNRSLFEQGSGGAECYSGSLGRRMLDR